jgi:hypothetical protein
MPELTRIECLKALHCEPTATAMDIINAYKRLRKKLHPDTQGTGNHTLFIHVTEAFETLKQHFNMDAVFSKAVKDLDEDAPPSVRTERQIQEELKQKLKETQQEKVLRQKIIRQKRLPQNYTAQCRYVWQQNF